MQKQSKICVLFLKRLEKRQRNMEKQLICPLPDVRPVGIADASQPSPSQSVHADSLLHCSLSRL